MLNSYAVKVMTKDGIDINQ